MLRGLGKHKADFCDSFLIRLYYQTVAQLASYNLVISATGRGRWHWHTRGVLTSYLEPIRL